VRIAPFAALVLTIGCGALEDPEEGMPPPINESVNGTTPGGGLPGTTGGNGTTTGGSDSGTTMASTSGADSTGTGLDLGMGVLFVGEILIGDGAWMAPLQCEVRFFTEQQLDPTTGLADEWETAVPVVVDAFPYELIITRNDVSSTVDFGSEGYIGVRCDFDGDGMVDQVGAFHPSLPAELVTLPVDGVTLELQFL